MRTEIPASFASPINAEPFIAIANCALVASRCLAQAAQIEKPQRAAYFVGRLSVSGDYNDLKLLAQARFAVVRAD